ncbi:MAG: hypothetical protein CUN55_19155 [Phototrophicales bacterium]|nr:MAG: hypothetical protein CUN55_19155 [Phototrophicales bacterium]
MVVPCEQLPVIDYKIDDIRMAELQEARRQTMSETSHTHKQQAATSSSAPRRQPSRDDIRAAGARDGQRTSYVDELLARRCYMAERAGMVTDHGAER